MPTRVALYAQPHSVPIAEQIAALKAVADEYGWTVVSVHTGTSDTRRRHRGKQSGLDTLLAATERSKVDQIAVTSACVLGGGSQSDFIDALRAAASKGIALYIHEEQLNTADLDPGVLRAVLDLLWKHSRAVRRDRIRAGQQRAREAGVTFGRPRVPDSKLNRAREILAEGKGVRETARAIGLSAALVCRVRQNMELSRAGPPPPP